MFIHKLNYKRCYIYVIEVNKTKMCLKAIKEPKKKRDGNKSIKATVLLFNFFLCS